MRYTIFGILQGRALHDIEIPIWAYYIQIQCTGLRSTARHIRLGILVFRRSMLRTTEYK